MARLDAVERTGLLTAAIRAAETRRPDRLYADPYAAEFAGDIGPGLLKEVREVTFPVNRARTLPSTPDYNAIRTRFFDEYLQRAAERYDQIVLAPAGMDARAFRLDWPRRIRLFEVDRPAVLEVKEEILAESEAKPVVDRTLIGVDLRDVDWTDKLLASGYDPSRPSAWLLEGLLYYIPEADVHRILDGVRAITAPGSAVAADVVNAAALTLPNMRGLLDVFAGWGCPWVFGTDEPEALFAKHGVTAEAVQPGEPAADYGRWPDPVPPRSEKDVRRVFFVHGTRTES